MARRCWPDSWQTCGNALKRKRLHVPQIAAPIRSRSSRRATTTGEEWFGQASSAPAPVARKLRDQASTGQFKEAGEPRKTELARSVRSVLDYARPSPRGLLPEGRRR